MSTRRSHDVNRITGTHTLNGSPRPHPWQHIQPDIGPEPDACRLQELQWPTQISISTIGRRLVGRLGRRGPAGTGTPPRSLSPNGTWPACRTARWVLHHD